MASKMVNPDCQTKHSEDQLNESDLHTSTSGQAHLRQRLRPYISLRRGGEVLRKQNRRRVLNGLFSRLKAESRIGPAHVHAVNPDVPEHERAQNRCQWNCQHAADDAAKQGGADHDRDDDG